MKPSFPLTNFILALGLIHISQSFQIKDLYTNDASFLADVEAWTATAVRHEVKYSQCDGTYLVGGYDVLGEANTNNGVQGFYFQRIYENLADHNIIYFTISLWLIDSWDPIPPDYFQLQFDSVLAEGWNFGYGNFTTNFCGNSYWPDLKNMTVFGQVSHSNSSLTLRIISQLDHWAVDESLGFRDVNLIFANSTKTNVNELCGVSSIPLPSNQCSCPYGEYFDDLYTFGCAPCDPGCRSCFGGTSQECYECEMGYSSVGSECIKCDESCAVCSGPNANQCLDCPIGSSLFNNEICISNCANTSLSGTVLLCEQPCETGQYFFSENQTCSEACNSPFSEEISASGAQLCMQSCGEEGFLYWDATCNSLCPSPLVSKTDNTQKSHCLYTCGIQEYLYWDGSCMETCDDVFISGSYKGRQFCQHPCGKITDYIYWNGSCVSDCEAPYVSSSDGKANYCSLPCSEEKPYWNGSSCLESCNQPFLAREEDGMDYCELPCQNGGYLYWNGSCIESCPLPYQAASEESGFKFCSYFCQQYGEYYYPREGQCLPTCDGPYQLEIQISYDEAWYLACVKRVMGKYPPEDNNDDGNEKPRGPLYYPITAVKIASEKIVGAFIALDIVLSLLSDSHVMILILVIKILNFIRFMDIRAPPQLVQEFNTFDNNHFFLNFGPAMSEGMREKFKARNLPMVFERAGLHSRFLVNFFKPITSFLIMLGVMMIIANLRRFLKKKADNKYILTKIILKKLEVFLKWNLVVLLVICNIDEITLYSVLEWKTESIGSAQDFFSLIASLGMFILAGVVIVAPFYLLNRIYNTRFKVLSNLANEPYFELLKKIEGFQVLWKDFKDSSRPQRVFMSIYILRIALMYLIVAVLYKRPLCQMILIFSMSLGMLIFMSIVKPFMKSLDFIQTVAYEVSMLLSIGSTLLLVVLDWTHANADQLWLFLGDVIQFCHILVTLTSVMIFLAKFYREIQRVREFYRTLPKPISRQQFWVLVLQENDPVNHELKKNKRTSTRLDLTNVEKEIQRKNLASYNISFVSADSPSSQSQSRSRSGSNNDDILFSYIPRKSELRIRRSLFSARKQSSGSEGSPVKTASTVDEEKSPCSADNLKLPNKILSSNDMKRNPQDCLPSQSESEERVDRKNNPEIEIDEKGEPVGLWRNLETIKEVDSMEISRMKTGEQTKRFQDLGCLSAINKRLSSETMMQKIEEETVITKETKDLVKKKLTIRDTVAQESLFQ